MPVVAMGVALLVQMPLRLAVPVDVVVDVSGDGDGVTGRVGQHRDGAREQLHPTVVSVSSQYSKTPHTISRIAAHSIAEPLAIA
jgi:hypothetical protein